MTRRTRTLALTLAATLTATLAGLTPAHAGTARQFANIQIGWTKEHVQTYIDDQGENVDFYTDGGGHLHSVKVYIVEDTGHTKWIDYRRWTNSDPYRVFDMWGDQAKTAARHAGHHVQLGWLRVHVQRVLGTTGHRILMYAGAHHRHLFKVYPAVDDKTYEYVGPLCQCPPLAGPYRLHAIS